MKFYKALLILVATVSLTLGNGLEVSDVEIENDVSGTGIDTLEDGFGNSSDVEIDHNAAPLENDQTIVPPSLPSMDNNIPVDNTPVDNTSVVPPADNIPSDNIPSDIGIPSEVGSSNDYPIDGTDNIPSADGLDQVPDNYDGISGQNADLGNSSDIEYDNIQPVDNADVSAQGSSDNIPAADGANEDSDDYGDSQPIDQIDNTDALDQIDSTNTLDAANVETLPETSDVEQENEGEQDGGNGGKIAGGLAAGAVASSVGLFYYIKRSKRAGLQSVRTQITMV